MVDMRYHIVGNFHDFHDQAPAREKIFLQKFLADNESSTVSLSHRSSKSTENSPIRANCGNFVTTYDQLTATANRSSKLAPSLWHGSFSLTASDTL